MREFVEARGSLRDQIPGAPQLPIELAFVRAVRNAGVEGTPAAAGAAAAPPPARPAAADAAAPAAAPVVAAHAEPDHAARDSAGEPHEAAAQDTGGDAAYTGDLLVAAQNSWDRFLTAAGKRCGAKVQAALRSVRSLDAAGDVIVLRFAHSFARDLVNSSENRILVEALWSELLGRNIQIRCQLAGENPLPLRMELAPGRQTAAAAPASGEAETARGAERSAGPGGDGDDAFLDSARALGATVKRLEDQ